ncbi:MAG: 4'-phosphopantetheinyl transferase family protein [Vulcanimicrobiaceae bacterium]
MNPESTTYVWQLQLEIPLQTNWQELLDASEHKRAASFLRPIDRHHFIVAHVAMREILGRAVGCQPQDVALTRGAHGKPELAGPNIGHWHFNLSHSGKLGILALCQGRRVGVDLELAKYPFCEIRDVAANFSDNERQAIGTLPPDEATAAFYRCWVRKEAFLKGVGTGLNIPLHTFSVRVDPGDAALIEVPLHIADANAWCLTDINVKNVNETYYAALAIEEPAGPQEENYWP